MHAWRSYWDPIDAAAPKGTYGLVYRNKIVARFDSRDEAHQEGRRLYGHGTFEIAKFEVIKVTGGGGGWTLGSVSTQPYLPVKIKHEPDLGEYGPPKPNYGFPPTA